MKHLTGKQATMTVTVKIEGEIESFFFYDMASYAEIMNAIHNAQAKVA
jgi:hypothetical protein